MSKRYAAEQRHINRTSLQTGVSERTLYDWRHKRQLQQQQIQPHELLQSLSSLQQQENERHEYDVLRNSMMQTALAIAQSLKINIDSRSMNRQVRALTSLLDRILELDSQEAHETVVETLRLEFVDETGKVSTTLPWAEPDDYDEDE